MQEILDDHPDVTHVLDPFCGTGTTGLVCAENNIHCDLLEINPFLTWFARVKTTQYPAENLQQTQIYAQEIVERAQCITDTTNLWMPPIHNINRWWHPRRLNTLAQIYHALQSHPIPSPAKDLLTVAFCNLVIHWSNAAFNHQSMSFKNDDAQQLSLFDEQTQILEQFVNLTQHITASAQDKLGGHINVIQADSRQVHSATQTQYDCVITSPPYPNQMSYIRELRPYMYWLGYLSTGREAGELDWQAIGGTWGIATSRLNQWQPNGNQIPYPNFAAILQTIAQQSPVLANYVHRYFIDIYKHIKSLYPVLKPGAKVFYIIGNSRFYDTLVPAETIYADILQDCGFVNTNIEIIRKRNSKKELFEFTVSAEKPNP